MRQRDGEDSVSSVVGTILMLAVTVTVFGGLSIVVLAEVRSTESPPEAELAFVSDGTRAVVTHRGGEPIPLNDGYLLVNVAGAEVRYDLTAFADQTADGKSWRIGETLCLSGPGAPCPLTEQTVLGVAIVASGGLLADEGERGGDAGPCPLDNAAPAAASPWTWGVDVLTTTTGPVTVTFTATDDCSGVDDAVEPSVFYRIQDGSNPAYTQIAASSVTNTGPGTWEAIVPSQSWNLLGGKSIEAYASGLGDTRGNVGGATATESELIDVVTLVQYVTTATLGQGSMGAMGLGPAQVESDSEAATTFTEGGTVGSPVSNGPTKVSGPTIVTGATATGAALNPNNVLSSNDVRAEFDATGDYIEVSGFDLPSDATVTGVTIGYEGRKASSGGTGSTMRLDYKVGSGTYSLGTTFIEDYFATSAPLDTDRTRTLCSTQAQCAALATPLTLANVEAMTVRVYDVADTTRNAQVDHVFITVTYTTPAVTTYALDLELDFAGTADGASETLELRYKTAGDTYRISVYDGAGYTSVGTLSSAGSFTTFTYTLSSAGQLNGGTPRFLVEDLTPTGTTAGSLEIDFARMVTT